MTPPVLVIRKHGRNARAVARRRLVEGAIKNAQATFYQKHLRLADPASRIASTFTSAEAAAPLTPESVKRAGEYLRRREEADRRYFDDLEAYRRGRPFGGLF